LTYANQSGIGHGPITGGLFLGSDAQAQVANPTRFAVSQDQRNTARFRVRFQVTPRVWLSGGAQYGSGLPADVSDTSESTLVAQYDAAVVNQVNLQRSRVHPNFLLDAAVGAELYHKEHRQASIQVQGTNLTNRLNVINFESVFSGTAIAPPRSASAQFQFTF